jgi:hypothetical protein
MTEEEKNQAAAYLKLQDDVKELVKNAMVEILRGYDYNVIAAVQNLTLGHPAFDTRVKQVITNQMQR